MIRKKRKKTVIYYNYLIKVLIINKIKNSINNNKYKNNIILKIK